MSNSALLDEIQLYVGIIFSIINGIGLFVTVVLACTKKYTEWKEQQTNQEKKESQLTIITKKENDIDVNSDADKTETESKEQQPDPADQADQSNPAANQANEEKEIDPTTTIEDNDNTVDNNNVDKPEIKTKTKEEETIPDVVDPAPQFLIQTFVILRQSQSDVDISIIDTIIQFISLLMSLYAITN